MAMIISGRAIQGVGGGGIIILANISVSDLFSMRYDRIDSLLVLLVYFERYKVNTLLTEIDLCTTVCLVPPGLLRVLWAPSSAALSLPVLRGDGASG